MIGAYDYKLDAYVYGWIFFLKKLLNENGHGNSFYVSLKCIKCSVRQITHRHKCS